MVTWKADPPTLQAVAVLGMGVLLFSHFPPEGSEMIDEAHEDEVSDESRNGHAE